MGDISKRLHRRLTKLAPPGVKDVPPKGWRPKEPAPDIPKLIAQGYDPIHAAYIFVHHITSVFSENVSRFPEMRTYAKEVGDAEEEYMPSGPPMSPLTTSYFTCWASLRPPDRDDHGHAGGLPHRGQRHDLHEPPPTGRSLRLMSQSRMGIYEHRGRRAATSGCGN